jgi:hypothetical protein
MKMKPVGSSLVLSVVWLVDGCGDSDFLPRVALFAVFFPELWDEDVLEWAGLSSLTLMTWINKINF